MSLSQFAKSHPNPRQRRKYLAAVEDLAANPLSLLKDARVKAFIKNERMPDLDWDNLKPPRMIQSRSTRFTALLGKYLKPIEKWLWGSCLQPLRHLFSKDMNNLEIGKRLTQLGDKSNHGDVPLCGRLVYILNDFSRYDSTQSSCLLREEAKIYKDAGAAYRASRTLSLLLNAQINNRCRTRFGIQYSSIGRRMSGDYNTSLGNTIVNYLALESLSRLTGIKYDAVINGDDSVICIREQDLDAYLAFSEVHFARLGLITKMNVVRDLHEVDFCQGKIVDTAEGYKLVRHPARALSHTAVSIKRYGSKRWLAWLRAVGECEVACNRGVPIMQSLGLCLMRNAWANGRVNAAYDRDLWYRKAGMRVAVLPVTDTARFWFWTAFGVTPDEQRRLESWYDNLTFVGPDFTRTLDAVDVQSLPPVDTAWMASLR